MDLNLSSMYFLCCGLVRRWGVNRKYSVYLLDVYTITPTVPVDEQCSWQSAYTHAYKKAELHMKRKIWYYYWIALLIHCGEVVNL